MGVCVRNRNEKLFGHTHETEKMEFEPMQVEVGCLGKDRF